MEQETKKRIREIMENLSGMPIPDKMRLYCFAYPLLDTPKKRHISLIL